jgi:hypothetical protein
VTTTDEYITQYSRAKDRTTFTVDDIKALMIGYADLKCDDQKSLCLIAYTEAVLTDKDVNASSNHIESGIINAPKPELK